MTNNFPRCSFLKDGSPYFIVTDINYLQFNVMNEIRYNSDGKPYFLVTKENYKYVLDEKLRTTCEEYFTNMNRKKILDDIFGLEFSSNSRD